jgi:hypothetical protein
MVFAKEGCAAMRLCLATYADLRQATVCTAAAVMLHLLGETPVCVADYLD